MEERVRQAVDSGKTEAENVKEAGGNKVRFYGFGFARVCIFCRTLS